jgi:hypothetical protein
MAFLHNRIEVDFNGIEYASNRNGLKKLPWPASFQSQAHSPCRALHLPASHGSGDAAPPRHERLTAMLERKTGSIAF